MTGNLEAITSFHKTSEGEATGPTGALFYPVVQCIANACPRLKKCELRCVSQEVSLSSVLEAVQAGSRARFESSAGTIPFCLE